jgi:hypothetical protein
VKRAAAIGSGFFIFQQPCAHLFFASVFLIRYLQTITVDSAKGIMKREAGANPALSP